MKFLHVIVVHERLYFYWVQKRYKFQFVRFWINNKLSDFLEFYISVNWAKIRDEISFLLQYIL